MNDVRQNGKFLAFFYSMSAPVISELVSRLLSGHPLLYPLLASALLLPIMTTAIQTGTLLLKALVQDLELRFLAISSGLTGLGVSRTATFFQEFSICLLVSIFNSFIQNIYATPELARVQFFNI